MKTQPIDIFNEYNKAVQFKTALGSRGLYDQTRINERFFMGDQWHGAKCGNDRPLVRHNVIKRIGEYKMAQVLSKPIAVKYSADGIPNTIGMSELEQEKALKLFSANNIALSQRADSNEINLVMSALSNYYRVTCERVGFSSICEQALKNAYISGSSVIYTYWDPDIKTGLYADEGRTAAVRGDIACEVLDIENVYFADPYCLDVQKQPYIIIASLCDVKAVEREAKAFGSEREILKELASNNSEEKVLVLTKLYKEYKENGEYSIKCVKVTERSTLRKPFDTMLRSYPIALFTWQQNGKSIYGESEVTYLIPNQIAINRMITAKVWASMSMGMPIMVVNGDTISGEITNEPGQVIKIYGSNEDVSGALKFVSPPDFSTNFDEGINSLIENTLTQSGANEAARGDSTPDNASAIIALQNMSSLPLQLIRNRFFATIEQVARIWADFWITQYGNRRIKIEDENGAWYMPFIAERYRELLISTRVDVGPDAVYSTTEQLNILNHLYEKGIIDKKQYLKRLPVGIVSNVGGIISNLTENAEEAYDERV